MIGRSLPVGLSIVLLSSSAALAQTPTLVPSNITLRVGSTVQATVINPAISTDCIVKDASVAVGGAGVRLQREGPFIVRGIGEGTAPIECTSCSGFGFFRCRTSILGLVDVRPNFDPLPCPPEVIVTPGEVEVAFGTPVTMSAVATASESTAIQWYWGAQGDTSNPVVGANLPNLDFVPTTPGEFRFWPRVSSFCGTTDGSQVIIRSRPCLVPKVTRQPADAEVLPGATATLFVEHTGVEPVTYQWFRGERGDVSSPLPSSNGGSIDVAASGLRERYWVRVSDSCGSTDSRAATVSSIRRSRPIVILRPLLPTKSILWIAAHPDDEILVAPLLAEVCAEGGGKCTILIATRGEKGGCELPGGCPRSELATIRTEEALRSAALLRATLSAGELPDGSGSSPEEVLAHWSALLGGRDKLVLRLVQEIVTSGAESIITFDPRHGSTCHPDHRAIGQLVAEAVATMGVAAPRTYLLTTRVLQTSSIDGSESVQWTQVDQEGEREVFYDSESRWHYVVDVAQVHQSQFSPATVGAISRVPPGDRVIGLIQLGAVRSLTVPDLCQAP